MSESRSLPPSQRDFEIYEAVHIAGCSTRSQAEKHEISQTRVRQIVRRVVEWLSEGLPPQAKVAKEQETHLARQIAADRFQHQYQQMTTFWDMTQESKYAGLRMRITTAQARLGVVGGLLDGLAADAIEGIPVPAWQPPADPNPESNPPKSDENPRSPAATADVPHPPGHHALDQLPPDLWDLLSFDDLTPEIVAALADRGRPVPPNLIRYAQEHGRMWSRGNAESADSTPDFSPPVEDCSTTNKSTDHAAQPLAENHDRSMIYDTPAQTESDLIVPCSPLLISHETQSVTSLNITPDQPGATIASPVSAPQEHQTSSSLPITLPSS